MIDIIGFWKSLSIRTKITSAFFLTTLLGIFLISLFANIMSNHILIEKSIVDNLGVLNQFSEKLDSSLTHANSMTKLAIANNIIQSSLAKNPDKMDQSESHAVLMGINLTLARLVDNSDILSGMAIYSMEDDRAFYSRGFQKYTTPDRQERDSVFASFTDGKYISWKDISKNIYRIYDEDINGLRLYRRLYMASHGRLSAIIESVIDEEYIASLYENIMRSDRGTIIISNAEGMIVSSQDKSRLFSDISDSSLFEVTLEHQGSGKVYKREGESFLTVNNYYSPLDWYIISEIPMRSLQHEIRMITGQIFLAGLFSLVLSLLIANSLSKSLTRPILSLQNSISESGHDLSIRAQVNSDDEIGALAREYNEMLDKQQSMMKRLVEEQKMLRKYELSLLQAQINPHFLYNALESVCGLIDLDRKDDAQMLVNELSRFYRGILSEGSSAITLKDELKITEHYVNILNVRYSGKIEYTVDIDDSLLVRQIIKMTLQPLIENAVYHGLKNTRPPWKINLNGHLSGDTFILELSDNGVGLDKTKIPDKDFFGFGTKTTNERLKLYFGQDSGITMENNEGGGTLVRIKLSSLKTEGI
ncbi:MULTISPECIES: sensor histidine kinase [unclassified Oceanispirochaeta]|uniref:sensor histidine kinase n=1 Tax=unclassified Oceanispirochaeta TaxID=2635722 RepID=UPI000E096C5E|nr:MULTISPECIES: sensor histidine kinase [unclassified Oceanispirochaeta]MBF9017577.1 histidine kinase [Oceanispirochaeta sp. M2]NPD74149.1 histidine kinase [Oceanispirochaeta sp. M1]RDG30068.1 sensor histidine kinase [Oceanispirochaeta sp. M1]